MAPPDESTRQQIITKRLEMLGTSSDSADYIRRSAMELVNTTPAILLDLCDRLNGVLASHASAAAGASPQPAVCVRQKLLDDALAAARQRVVERKDSMETCAAKWIERSRRDGLFAAFTDIY